MDPGRKTLGPIQIARSHPFKEIRPFSFESIEFALPPEALLSHSDRHVEQEREIGLQAALNPCLEDFEPVEAHSPAPALIGKGRISEPIAEHHLVLLQERARSHGRGVRAGPRTSGALRSPVRWDGRSRAANREAPHPIGVPPGSLVSTTGRCRASKYSPSHLRWVVFPAPSMPSTVMNRPAMSTLIVSAGTSGRRDYAPPACGKTRTCHHRATRNRGRNWGVDSKPHRSTPHPASQWDWAAIRLECRCCTARRFRDRVCAGFHRSSSPARISRSDRFAAACPA